MIWSSQSFRLAQFLKWTWSFPPLVSRNKTPQERACLPRPHAPFSESKLVVGGRKWQQRASGGFALLRTFAAEHGFHQRIPLRGGGGDKGGFHRQQAVDPDRWHGVQFARM